MNCCGLAGLSGWNSTPAVGSTFDGSALKTGGYSNYLVVLNGTQREVWHDQLIKAGFKVLRNGLYNGIHNSLLTLYIWEKNPELSPDNPEFKENLSIFQDRNGYRTVRVQSGNASRKMSIEEFKKG
jgi:hypothetical protein